ncbi:NADH dehydrogenase [ubiquinone] 1 beta subcomplex subunit 5, mitochondrial-like [Mercenaria mercenaria]|uniref:NADH dehydrogenase [ubiquinone] 1 beta subcomplex subunit 5, mitochondrial-like n=1 Tax=Mercenaria mercenaria TaxID=6596 RepID=UPI00234F02F0|nr:NADH dehydrogenase [ubiquinone] 1 beta subcomplex subunit 5, mitochondrial-like [Mercenaria mercenaria]
MPILSTLRTTASAGVRFAQALVQKSQQTKVPVRYMGGNKMVVRPSRFQSQQLKDDVFYFLSLGIVPLGLIVLYTNVRIGPAELVDTPEGYVPEKHEYYKLPITRYISKYLSFNSIEKYHERSLYYLYKADMKRKAKLEQKKVRQLQKSQVDQKGWYYVPIQGTLEQREQSYESFKPNKKV